MAEIYGHRWTSAYGEDPDTGAGPTWAKGLAGVATPQLAAGLAASIASADPWPPTLPEFRLRCLGVPSLATVRLDTEKDGAFTRLVWQSLDAYRYKQSSADQADRLLREAYELAREHVMRGGALPGSSAGSIEHRSSKPQGIPETRAARAQRLADLGIVQEVGKMAAAEQGASS